MKGTTQRDSTDSCESYYTNDSHVSGNKFTRKLQYFTEAYVDDLTAAGPIAQLKKIMG